nr:hypothetical protein [Marinicella sp. W31]MDC2878702.1 hypothetical protein [Marinicella sp. W31]
MIKFLTGKNTATTRRQKPLRRALAGILLLGIAAYYLVPMIIAPNTMAKNLTDGLTEWLGAPASIAGTSDISFWPRPRITATSVAVSRPDGTGPLIYGNGATLSARFGLFGALSGDPAFSDFTLDNAIIILEKPEASWALLPTTSAKQSIASSTNTTRVCTPKGSIPLN